MTTFVEDIFKCDFCGEEFTDKVMSSTSAFGSMDLDTRPPSPKRYSLDLLLHQCPKCGYVLQNESEIPDNIRALVKTDSYQSCDGITFKNDVAVKFYRDALISMVKEQYRHAAMSFLHSAWACDDMIDEDNAIYCRKQFLDCFDKIPEDSRDADIKLIRVDVLRRAQEFDTVLEEFDKLSFDDDFLTQIAEFEKQKCIEKDDKCYTVDDVMKNL